MQCTRRSRRTGSRRCRRTGTCGRGGERWRRTRGRSCRSASPTRSGWRTRSRRSWRRRARCGWTARRSCTRTCGATTCASSTGGRCSSTGRGRREAIRRWTWRRGSRASMRRAGRGRTSCSRTRVRRRRRSRGGGRRGRDFRRPRNRACAKCSGRSSRWRCRGRAARWASPRHGVSEGSVSVPFVYATDLPFRTRPPRRGVRNDPAKARFLTAVATMRLAQIEAARALVDVDDCGHVVFEGCASIGEFGERYGVSASETRRLLAMGRAIQAYPEVEQKVREGRIPVASAAVIGWVVTKPGMLRPGDRRVEWAETESTQDLIDRYERRREEVVLDPDAKAVWLKFYVSARTSYRFDRARRLACRKEGVALTKGQAFVQILDHFIDSFDMLAKTPRRRRMADTAGRPGRPRAAAGKRDLMSPGADRRGADIRGVDRCSVPFCDNKTFLENAHGVAKAEGGDQESANTARDCSGHHTMVDSGQMQMRGTPQNPRYETNDGRSLSERFAPPNDRPAEKSARPGPDPPSG